MRTCSSALRAQPKAVRRYSSGGVCAEYWAFDSVRVLVDAPLPVFTHLEGPWMAKSEGWSNDLVKLYGNGNTEGGVCTGAGPCYHGPFDGDTPTVSKTFTGLPAHTKVTVSLRYWSVDSWDTEEAYVKIEGNKVWSKMY